MKKIISQSGFLVSGEGIRHLLRERCECCEDHNKYLEIDPLEPKNITSISVDVRVGRYCWTFDDKPSHPAFFSTSVDDIESFLDTYAIKYDVCNDLPGYITIKKDEFLLLEVFEKIKLNRHIFGQVLGKSTLARVGLTVESASIINPMFQQHLILEIKNLNNVTVRLNYQSPIAQVIFFFFPIPIEKHYQVYGKFV